MSLIDNLKAGATLTMLQVAQGLATGTITSTLSDTKTNLTVPMPDGFVPDANAAFIYSEALASAEMLAFFGLDATKGQQYVLVKLYAVPMDPESVPSLPAGSWPLPEINESEPLDNSNILMQAWVFGDPSAPWKAAWSSGQNCEIIDENGNWVAAPTNVTLAPGSWRGTGCIGKPRKEWAGISSSAGLPIITTEE